jgi:hypothetical protein
MQNLSENEKIEIGKKIAELFCIPKSNFNSEKFVTTWGLKNALGLFNMFEVVNSNIQNFREIKI